MATEKAQTRRTQLTLEKVREVFLAALAETCSVSRSAKKAKVARSMVYEWREADPKFRAKWNKAIEMGVDALEDEAIRRAVQGVLKPIYQGGVKVGTIRQYSDTLMALLLKGHMPEKYRERTDLKVSGTLGLAEAIEAGRKRVKNAKS